MELTCENYKKGLYLVIKLLVQLAYLLFILLTLLLGNADNNGGSVVVQDGPLLYGLETGHILWLSPLCLRHVLS